MFPKALNKFYWSVIEKFPFYFVSVFLLGWCGLWANGAYKKL